jgi:hypothetical protein
VPSAHSLVDGLFRQATKSVREIILCSDRSFGLEAVDRVNIAIAQFLSQRAHRTILWKYDSATKKRVKTRLSAPINGPMPLEFV